MTRVYARRQGSSQKATNAVNCLLELTTLTDRPYWIRWERFKSCVDKDDLARRRSSVVSNYYLDAWFSYSENGQRCFNPPAVYLERGRALFINGRHRAILLSTHMKIIPMVITKIDALSRQVFDIIVEREIGPEEVIVLPDLPIY